MVRKINSNDMNERKENKKIDTSVYTRIVKGDYDGYRFKTDHPELYGRYSSFSKFIEASKDSLDNRN